MLFNEIEFNKLRMNRADFYTLHIWFRISFSLSPLWRLPKSKAFFLTPASHLRLMSYRYVTDPVYRKTGQYISGFTAGGTEFQNIS